MLNVVVMITKLKEMGLLNHSIPDQLNIHEKIVEKVVLVGTFTKDSFSSPYHNIETTPPHIDNTERLSMMIDDIP